MIFGSEFLGLLLFIAVVYGIFKAIQKSKENADELQDGDGIVFSASLLLFWIKGSIDVDSHNVNTSIPNRVFYGLVPMEVHNSKIRLKTVSNVRTTSSFDVLRILIGLFFFLSIITIPLGLIIIDSAIQ